MAGGLNLIENEIEAVPQIERNRQLRERLEVARLPLRAGPSEPVPEKGWRQDRGVAGQGRHEQVQMPVGLGCDPHRRLADRAENRIETIQRDIAGQIIEASPGQPLGRFGPVSGRAHAATAARPGRQSTWPNRVVVAEERVEHERCQLAAAQFSSGYMYAVKGSSWNAWANTTAGRPTSPGYESLSSDAYIHQRTTSVGNGLAP